MPKIEQPSSLVLVAGASGLIGGHLVGRLLEHGWQVRAVGRRPFSEWLKLHPAAENIQLDLRDKANCHRAAEGVDQVFNLAADIGGVGFISSAKAATMLSVLINTHLLMASRDLGVKRYFYASSQAVAAADLAGASALDEGHVWEKLFSEKLTRYFGEEHGIAARIGRLENIYGAPDRYAGGRERAPAALCRKAIEAKMAGNDTLEIWGDGTQIRSFLWAEDCAEGLMRLMSSDIREPVRIGSNELVSVNNLVDAIEEAASTKFERVYNTSAPRGIERRPDTVTAIDPRLGWQPKVTLRDGISRLYHWIEVEMAKAAHEA